MIRDAGALAELRIQLDSLGSPTVLMGDFPSAEALVAEVESVAAATGSHFPSHTALRLRAMQGLEADTSALIATVIDRAAAGGQEIGVAQARWAAATLYNGLARYEEAASASREAAMDTLEPWISAFVLPELVEAAARAG